MRTEKQFISNLVEKYKNNEISAIEAMSKLKEYLSELNSNEANVEQVVKSVKPKRLGDMNFNI